jgi:hypothetical protein
MCKSKFIVYVLGIAASSAITAFGADTCRQGYVWREAFAGDHVCVSPAIRDQSAQDNSQANARRARGGGPYGPDSCIVGYVWREGRSDDHVCVTPQVRAQTASENNQAASRRADSAPTNPPVRPQDRQPRPDRDRGNLANDTAGWDQYGYALDVHRSESLSDLIFTWECRPPNNYDAFNVRVRISDGREGQVEVRGGTRGSYRERNAGVGLTYTFMVQGCDKGTFRSKCATWDQRTVRNDRNLQ